MSELDDIRKRTEGHTPGPLELVSFDIDTDDHIDIAAHPVKYEGGRITAKWTASVENGSGELTEEDHANALLFAAAPDLLRIATELTAERDKWKRVADEAIAGARAALTQREGGEE